MQSVACWELKWIKLLISPIDPPTLKTERHVWKAALSTKLQIITIITPLFMAIATVLGISLHRGYNNH